MKEPMISNEWIEKILGSSQEKLYQEGYQRGLKHCHDEGGEEYYVPFLRKALYRAMLNKCWLICASWQRNRISRCQRSRNPIK